MTDSTEKTQAADSTGRDYRETLFLPKTEFPMRAGLPKQEPAWLERWEKLGLYDRMRAEAKGRTPWILHDGPPYANGHLHIGHALNKVLKDFVVRSHQMAGFDASYVPGWDCHGLPIEWKVEEAYRAKGKKKDDVPVNEFRKACRDYAEEWVGVQTEEFLRLGVIGDYKNPYTTMAYSSEAAIVAEFLKFAMTDQLYRGSKPVMWSPVEQTALAEAEVEYHDHTSHTIWVRFPVVKNPREITRGGEEPSARDASVLIWTTTPWTIPGNRAIAFGPSLSYGLYEVKTVGEFVDPRSNEKLTPWAKVGEKLVVADALWESVAAAAKIEGFARIGGVDPSVWKCAHPFRGMDGADGYFDFDVPLLPGDHVTEEAGTGFVHTAPSHGQEDYEVWVANGLPRDAIPDMVDERGAYYDHVPFFAGEQVIRTEGKKAGEDGGANPAVIKKLIEADALLARGRMKHSYPHSWRSKAPLIFRNTPQWFIPLDKKGDDGKTLREKALAAIDAVTWHPDGSVNRIRAMVADRPDWLISRQRAWGVPLTLFVNKAGDYLQDDAVNARVLAAVQAHGADAWFTTPAQEFLGAEYSAEEWTKVEDILDVWFDSGSTHAFTLEGRGYPWPADLYLEGSDQHRGWFQSSLLEACGTRGTAPYKEVLTHGFVMDEQGEKMAKSKGNVVAPAEVASQYGSDILRLWVATSDYEQDLRVGPNIIQANVDGYRRLRNTVRYLLGALEGFTDEERIGAEDMPQLERWVLHRLAVLDETVRDGYARFKFKETFAELFRFCTNDLSAFYLDVRKDALYCDAPDSARRRACRTVMDLVFERLTAWLAPILPFTMEEAWLSRFPSDDGSVHLRVNPETPETWRDDALAERWARVRKVRRVVTGALEVERREKRIGASLEAAPVVHVALEDDRAALEAAAGAGDADALLAELAITSGARIVADEGPAEAFRLDDVAGVAVVPARATGVKCARSWKYFDPATADPRYPDVTPRDAEAVAKWDAAHGR